MNLVSGRMMVKNCAANTVNRLKRLLIIRGCAVVRLAKNVKDKGVINQITPQDCWLTAASQNKTKLRIDNPKPKCQALRCHTPLPRLNPHSATMTTDTTVAQR